MTVAYCCCESYNGLSTYADHKRRRLQQCTRTRRWFGAVRWTSGAAAEERRGGGVNGGVQWSSRPRRLPRYIRTSTGCAVRPAAGTKCPACVACVQPVNTTGYCLSLLSQRSSLSHAGLIIYYRSGPFAFSLYLHVAVYDGLFDGVNTVINHMDSYAVCPTPIMRTLADSSRGRP